MTILKKVKIHISILVYLILCLFSGFIVDGLMIMGILLIHELSHVLMVVLSKGKIKQVTLTLVGGLMDVELPNGRFFNQLLINSVRPD